MFGLTALGLVHTVIGLVALVLGVVALKQSKQITSTTPMGRWYLGLTLAAALTALGIFTRGALGPGHVLALLTLAALAAGLAAERTGLFGGWSRTLRIVAYSATFLFHLIPGITETTTRLPAGAPLVASPESPALVPVFGVLLVLYIVGVVWQLRTLKPALPTAAA
jgi:uncharacterized membrane protein